MIEMLLYAIGILILAFALDLRLLVRRYQISAKGLHSPARIVLLSDLHATRHGDHQARLLQKIKEIEPDLVLMAGDMVDRGRSTREFEYLCLGLEIYPSYYAVGNHECNRADLQAVKEKAKASGVTVLTNETVTAQIGEEVFSISGIDDTSLARQHDPEFNHEVVAKRLSEATAQMSGYRILIAHRPELINRYTGFDLVVSGHTHGGLLRIPGLLNGLVAPGQGVLPKLTGGVYQRGETTLVISRGISRHLLRPRICNRPEIVVIELLPMR